MVLTYIAYFVLALILHEVGHCIAAYACRVKVTELGLAWGPQVYAFRFGRSLMELECCRLELTSVLTYPDC